MEIELHLADCPQNLDLFGLVTRKDVDMGDIFLDAVLFLMIIFIVSYKSLTLRVEKT